MYLSHLGMARLYCPLVPRVFNVDGDRCGVGHVPEPAVVRCDGLGDVEALLHIGRTHVHFVILQEEELVR